MTIKMSEGERVEALLEWAMERNLSGDPDVILKLYDEARRRWGHLTSRYGLGKIVEAALLKMKVEKKRESKSL